jgi:hypothetical protein
MAWGGSHEPEAVGDDVYEPLPEMDRDELQRLRATIGLPDESLEPVRLRIRFPADQREPIRPRAAAPIIELHDSDPPDGNLQELLQEVDRKLEKLIDMGPTPVFNSFFGDALVSLHSEIGDMNRSLAQLQASIDALQARLFG